MKRIVLFFLIAASQSIVWAEGPFARAVHPNPLMELSDEAFRPLAEEIEWFKKIGVFRPVNEGGISEAEAVFQGADDQKLQNDLKAVTRGHGLDAEMLHAYVESCALEMKESLVKLATDILGPHSGRETAGRYVMDPRVYERAVRILESAERPSPDTSAGLTRIHLAKETAAAVEIIHG